MGLIDKLKDKFLINRQDSIIFEVTQPCNNDCLFCYNAWKVTDTHYPKGELDTGETKRLIAKIIKETKCKQFTFTGGEPFLRKDLADLVSFTKEQGVSVTIISNGTLITEDVAKDFIKRGVGLFELPILSADRAIHDALSRNKGAFDKVTESIANIKLHNGLVVAVFVGTKKNIDGFSEMIELAIALGVDGIMFNRFNVGGEGVRHIEELLPTPEQVIRALEVTEEAMEKYKISISCSIPVQPCVIDTSRFKKVHFGYCAAGTKRSYYTVDPMGNIRPCNHTPMILGNILKDSFTSISKPDKISEFTEPIPEFCQDCAMVKTCLGGCKASAQVCYGSLSAEEPFIKYYKKEALKRRLRADKVATVSQAD
ncbi:MAG: radical SAM protein [Planctomycetes bacterium]|nr:radical SAM protein [Planctomycetota bacterium]